MKNLLKLAVVGCALASTPVWAEDAGPLSGLDGTLNAVNLLVDAGSAPGLAPDLLTNVGSGIGIIALNGLGDPTSLIGLSPLDLGSLGDVATGTIMIQNYPGGAALVPVINVVGGVVGGVIDSVR